MKREDTGWNILYLQDNKHEWETKVTHDGVEITYREKPINQSDWKTLDVNCLEPDILVGNYEVQEMDDKNEYHTIIVGYTGTILLNMQSRNAKYRYRPTPTKKSNEELAEDYAKKVDKRSARVISFEEIVALREGFISGRKSMESEK